jgi:hypothetical protein
LSAFLFYAANILAFVNQPPWHIKAAIIAVLSIPAAVFLLLGAFFGGFSHTQPIQAFLLSSSPLSALATLSFLCVWASPDMARYFSADTFHFFSDTVSGIVCLSLYVLIGFGLLFHSAPKRPERST